MNILFVNNFRYRGGGEEFLLDLLPGLVKRGAGVGIVCRPNSPLAAMFKGTGVKVYPVEKNGIQGLVSFFKIANIIRSERYEIISIQRGHDIVQALLGAILSRTLPRFVYTVHVADFINSRFLLRRMDRIIVISRHIKNKLEIFDSLLSSKIFIIHNGIDLSLFSRTRRSPGFIRSRFGLLPDTPLLSTSGSMWKNQIEFLDALVKIRSEVPDIRYLLLTPMADMPQMRDFKERAAQLGIADSILWMDALPKEDMPLYFADIDLAISTFRNEGFGIWVIEALAMGTPVAAYDDGGVRDSLEGCSAGVLVNDAREMASQVVRVLKDPVLKKRMSDAGPAWIAERFSRERMLDDYHDLFGSLLDYQKGTGTVR